MRDTAKLETLATLYALAGAALIDVAAEPAVVEAAVRGIARARALRPSPPAWLSAALPAGPPATPDPLVMVSITLSGDRHTQIAVVDDTCTTCDLCTDVCPPGAIVNGLVEAPICTGCGLCVPVCPPVSIVLAARETAPDLDACWEAGARALEIHTGAAETSELAEAEPLAVNWQKRGGLLSYSVDGRQLGYARALALATALGRPGIIIQADGKPISGTVGERSTVPALRLARAMIRSRNPAWIQPAGGTNDHTGRLADQHRVAIAGVGVGSFARQCARALEQGDDTPASWTYALTHARALVSSTQADPRAATPLPSESRNRAAARPN